MSIMQRAFYHRDSLIVAQELLGKILVHEIDGQRVAVKIVETEAYMGIDDKAAHSYGGRRTKRVEVLYGKPGFAYVYLIYGMYDCLNVVTQEEGVPQAVLIRAAEPVEGLDSISQARYQKPYCELTKQQIRNLTSGPGKLCKALHIDRKLNGEDLCGGQLYIEEGTNDIVTVVSAKRVGIDYAKEAKEYLWRFYIENNDYVSVL